MQEESKDKTMACEIPTTFGCLNLYFPSAAHDSWDFSFFFNFFFARMPKIRIRHKYPQDETHLQENSYPNSHNKTTPGLIYLRQIFTGQLSILWPDFWLRKAIFSLKDKFQI